MRTQPYNAVPSVAPGLAPHYKTLEEIVPRDWANQTVLANGIRQHFYRTGGPKPALILLHGFQENGICWLRVAASLAADYDVVMPDARGHGLTECPESGYAFEPLVADVAELIAALGLPRPAIVGRSNGAAIALGLALALPQLVRAIVLEEPPMRAAFDPLAMNDERYLAWQRNWLAWMESLKSMSHDERIASLFQHWPPGWPSDFAEEDLVTWAEAQKQFNLDILKSAASFKPLILSPEVLSRIECPILLLTGNPALGGGSLPDRTPAIAAAIRCGRHVHFDDAGHLISRAQFVPFIAELKSFLAQGQTT